MRERVAMHEMAIASEIVDCLLDIAGRHNAARIGEVEVEIGRMRRVVPEALEMAFSAAVVGTIAEGATLKLREIEVTAVCNDCGTTYGPDIDVSFVCPSCGHANPRITAGDDIVLRNITCDVDKGVST
ncbi:MAG: hydrogenase maturation nickel metallochaperone HypA [Phycisphaerae bacterium]